MNAYRKLVWDFSFRTKVNVGLVNAIANFDEDSSGLHIHELDDPVIDYNKEPFFIIAQIINSLLGIVVLPNDYVIESFADEPLYLFCGTSSNWPDLEKMQGEPPVYTFKQFIHQFRNAVAHFNLRLKAENGQISGIEVNNINSELLHWRTEFDIDDLLKLIKELSGLWQRYEVGINPRTNNPFDLGNWLQNHLSELSSSVGMDLHNPLVNFKHGNEVIPLVLDDLSGNKVVVQYRLGASDENDLLGLEHNLSLVGGNVGVWLVSDLNSRENHKDSIKTKDNNSEENYYLIQIEGIDSSQPNLKVHYP